jgi:histidyl-tRNA synthetase
MDLTPPRGTDDLLPPRSEIIRALSEAAGRQAELFGYRFVETPAFEATELFSRTSGESSDVVRKEMYTFDDSKGRSFTLRPEGTAPVVRAYLANAHDLPSPFKAYYLEPMWRHGRPQAGRLREFRQFGVEVLGSADPAADVEVVTLGSRYLQVAGMERLELKVNSIGDQSCRPAYRDELIAFLDANIERLRDEHRDHYKDNPLRVFDCKDEACREVSAEAPKISDRLCDPCAEHFDAVRAGLEAERLAFIHDLTLVRGLDYYTRTAFEWISPALSGGQDSVGGGGRYDGLAEVLGGPPTPGVGFAMGLERILLALEEEGEGIVVPPLLDCFVVSLGEAAGRQAALILRALRDADISAAKAFDERPLKAQLRMAHRSGARFALIIGEREAAGETVTVRRLEDGHQEELGLEAAIVHIKSEGRSW